MGKAKITFLEELKEQARKHGRLTMATDYDEIKDFVRWCFKERGENPPTDKELEPYDEGTQR